MKRKQAIATVSLAAGAVAAIFVSSKERRTRREEELKRRFEEEAMQRLEGEGGLVCS